MSRAAGAGMKSLDFPPGPRVYWGDAEAQPDVRLLGIRPHARARGRYGARRRHRPQLPDAAGRGDVLPHDARPRVRRVRDVALVIQRVAPFAESAVHRHPGLSVALLPPLVHFRSREERYPAAGRPEGQAGRRAGVPDDRAGLDPRHPLGRIRRQGDRLRAPLGRRRRARPHRQAEDRPAARDPRAADRRDANARADDRRGRARRHGDGARALDLLYAPAGREAAISRLRLGRTRVLPAHPDLSDHAYGGDPPGRLREEPLGRAVALQGARAIEVACDGTLPPDGGDAGDAALAGRPCGGSAARDGRGLVAVRRRSEPSGTRYILALSPRAGTFEAPAAAGRALRARDARGVQGLAWRARALPIDRRFRSSSWRPSLSSSAGSSCRTPAGAWKRSSPPWKPPRRGSNPIPGRSRIAPP